MCRRRGWPVRRPAVSSTTPLPSVGHTTSGFEICGCSHWSFRSDPGQKTVKIAPQFGCHNAAALMRAAASLPGLMRHSTPIYVDPATLYCSSLCRLFKRKWRDVHEQTWTQVSVDDLRRLYKAKGLNVERKSKDQMITDLSPLFKSPKVNYTWQVRMQSCVDSPRKPNELGRETSQCCRMVLHWAVSNPLRRGRKLRGRCVTSGMPRGREATQGAGGAIAGDYAALTMSELHEEAIAEGCRHPSQKGASSGVFYQFSLSVRCA